MKLVAIFAAFLLTTLTVQSQEPQTVDTISIDTNLISVPVIVSDRDNRYVPDLKIDSFHLFDNQIEQKITYFDTGEEAGAVHFITHRRNGPVAHKAVDVRPGVRMKASI